jgi:tRNA threonylcarbamoyladenosine biosynthesis protein TsaB
MNILAFDTATETFAIGLSCGEKSYFLEIQGGSKHSQLIMDAAETLLGLADVKKEDLEATACMEGPGSFTGLRIGFAAAKGIALARGIPLIAVPTLDCMAAPHSIWPGLVLPLIDAKRHSFYTALYCHGKRLGPYLDSTIDDLVKIISPHITANPSLLLTGPAATMAYSVLLEAFPGTTVNPVFQRGHAAELLNLAEKKGILNRTGTGSGPIYLRKSDAEENFNQSECNAGSA